MPFNVNDESKVSKIIGSIIWVSDDDGDEVNDEENDELNAVDDDDDVFDDNSEQLSWVFVVGVFEELGAIDVDMISDEVRACFDQL